MRLASIDMPHYVYPCSCKDGEFYVTIKQDGDINKMTLTCKQCGAVKTHSYSQEGKLLE